MRVDLLDAPVVGAEVDLGEALEAELRAQRVVRGGDVGGGRVAAHAEHLVVVLALHAEVGVQDLLAQRLDGGVGGRLRGRARRGVRRRPPASA